MSAHVENGGPASAGPAFDLVARVVKFATGLVLVALVVLVCGEAFLRGVANYSLGFAEELTGYFVVMLTFFGAALALRAGALFRVNFLFDAMPANTRKTVQIVFAAAALTICIIFVLKTAGVAMSSFERGKFAPTVLRTPLWIPQMLMPAGFAVIAVFLVEQLLLSLRIWKGGA
ncbi:TRAP-type C4-dicarboxylate transport system, small permease component [Paracoccus halophilus]|uniref:TRAP transporter small permease protein n=1 Tax=Paracoccus halophilus TaxID=376733 RepID=A0A099F5B4_9RHOB|nr:TRAP transporter small permease [Paracoccus halophilus]KGJ05453.1 ABC transporter substrate-binding protein [Paracoccus halophilus]SFA49326.1 TRAP-type C4-dicarboxylate transport system, small permease component [Paracoccus halophilus]